MSVLVTLLHYKSIKIQWMWTSKILWVQTTVSPVHQKKKPFSSISFGLWRCAWDSVHPSFHPLLPVVYSNQAKHHIGFFDHDRNFTYLVYFLCVRQIACATLRDRKPIKADKDNSLLWKLYHTSISTTLYFAGPIINKFPNVRQCSVKPCNQKWKSCLYMAGV